MTIVLRGYKQDCQDELQKCQNEISDLNKRYEDEKKSRQSCQLNYENYARSMKNAYKQRGKRSERRSRWRKKKEEYNFLWTLIFMGIIVALLLFIKFILLK